MNFYEEVDFGKKIGLKNICQLTGHAHQIACLQVNSKDIDNTGLRIHGGAHVAIRFLLKHPEFIQNKRVCELGCGTAVVGLLGTNGGIVSSHLLLTDGNIEAVTIASLNVEQLASAPNNSKISCRQLLWGLKSDVDVMVKSLTSIFDKDSMNECEGENVETNEFTKLHSLEKIATTKHFDVVVGCELFYYRTNIQDLLTTVLHLTDNLGVFIHSHVFRRPGQDTELISFLGEYNWITLEIPIESFIDEEELFNHPEWYNVHCLISGTRERMENILAVMNADNDEGGNRSKSLFLWKIFNGSRGYYDGLFSEVIPEDIDNEMSLANLFPSS
jgi:predicted nicotinamide N-methyase